MAVVPIPPRTKAPQLDDWQTLRLSESEVDRHFAARSNIGVILGDPSGGLVDVDLDHQLAVELADEFLPPTNSEFGRPSKRRSHRLYLVDGAKTHQRSVKPHGMIVEIRSTG